ncbi:MAG TPA: low affinity iron permease family protein, partial [Candidatus Saccharimonadales bacterium]|nr:low affinity iron permease family protein [Candidatus Saccharimonadales bacterium]
SKNIGQLFNAFTSKTSIVLGRAWIFVLALVLLAAWAVSGPLFGFSDTWQLIVNTTTTIITFLMVFVIQNTQNRDNMAINIKLDAIMDKLGIDAQKLITAEEFSDKHLENEKKRVQNRAKKRKSK